MLKSETLKLVTFINSIEGRETREVQVEAWHEIIGDQDFSRTMERAKNHYRSEAGRLWPAMLRRPSEQPRFTVPPGHVAVYDDMTGALLGTRPA